MIIDCPSCHNKFATGEEEPDINRCLICPHCNKFFEVTWLYPFTLDFVEDCACDLTPLVESL